ncbi:MAG: hypothetical protein ACI9VR_002818 [Cognaticolwellia sp.]|jgi:hypothetical protein
MEDQPASAAQMQALLLPAQDRELVAALTMETRLPPLQIQAALARGSAPNAAVDAALTRMLSDPDERMGMAAMEACIHLGGRGKDMSAHLFSQGGIGASRALIVHAWVLPKNQAVALLERELSGPRGRLAALELARLTPSPETQARILALKASAPEQDQILLDYAARIAGERLYQDLPEGGL